MASVAAESEINWDVPLINGQDGRLTHQNFEKYTVQPNFTDLLEKYGQPPKERATGLSKPVILKKKDLKKLLRNPKWSGLPYPRLSSLSTEEQKIYLELYFKFMNEPDQTCDRQMMSAQWQTEIKQFKDLQAKVGPEQEEFMGFLYCIAKKNLDHYSYLNPSVALYIKELLDYWHQDVRNYPRYFYAHKTIGLSTIAPSAKDPIFQRVTTILQLGKFLPNAIPSHYFNEKTYIPRNYKAMVESCPFHKIVGKNRRYDRKGFIREDVVCDKVVVDILKQHKVDFVMSGKTLETLVDNHLPDLEQEWEISVYVKAYSQINSDGSPEMRKTIFLKEPLASKELTQRQKNNLYYSITLKKFYRSTGNIAFWRDRRKGRATKKMKNTEQTVGTEEEGEEEKFDGDGEENDLSDQTEKEIKSSSDSNCHFKGVPSEREDFSDSSLDFWDDENKLVILTDDEFKSPIKPNLDKIKKNQTESPIFRRRSSRLQKKMEPGQEGDDAQQTPIETNRNGAATSVSIVEEDVDDSQLIPDETDQMLSVPTLKEEDKQNKLSASPRDSTTPASVSQSKRKLGCDTSSPASFPQASPTEIPLGSLTEDPCYNANYEVEGNLVYSLWSFGQFTILLRNSHDGYLLTGDKTECPVIIRPKLEYQTEFGFEQVTLSEISRQWIKLYTLPKKTTLVRVRINAFTSEVILSEETNLAKILNPPCSFSPDKSMKMVFHIISNLSGLPHGHFLLSHSKGAPHLTIFQNISKKSADKEKKGCYDLHSVHSNLTRDVSEPSTHDEPSIPWIPLDPNLFLPEHKMKNRIPCTFPPYPVEKIL